MKAKDIKNKGTRIDMKLTEMIHKLEQRKRERTDETQILYPRHRRPA